MTILLFGGSGQLGTEVQVRAGLRQEEVVAPHDSLLDITAPNEVLRWVAQVRPTVIINCAAYTNVDKAEEERELAFAVNAQAAEYIARAAAQYKARLVHVSTDYVFPGTEGRPLTETDSVGPINVYGESKLAGELAVQEAAGSRSVIVRTSSLHGRAGRNFVHTMIKLLTSREELSIVADQVMAPTWAGWLAETLLELANRSEVGVVHAAGGGSISWFEFTEAIKAELAAAWPKLSLAELQAVTTDEFPRPAKRPAHSVLDCGKLEGWLGAAVLPWREGLRAHLNGAGVLSGALSSSGAAA